MGSIWMSPLANAALISASQRIIASLLQQRPGHAEPRPRLESGLRQVHDSRVALYRDQPDQQAPGDHLPLGDVMACDHVVLVHERRHVTAIRQVDADRSFIGKESPAHLARKCGTLLVAL